jgi:hypothetical protein
VSTIFRRALFCTLGHLIWCIFSASNSIALSVL